MTKNNFEQLNDLNVEFFESAKLSLLDPLGLYLANDVKWIKLNQNLDKISEFTCNDNSEIHFLPFKITKQDIIEVIKNFEKQKIKI